MILYNMNDEAFHIIFCNEQIENEILVPCSNLALYLDDYGHAYYINENVINDNIISEFIKEITKICLNDKKLLWVDLKEYNLISKEKERKKINVLSDDINIIKYILEYDIYDYSKELELMYE